MVNFSEATSNDVIEQGGNMMVAPPSIVTTSPKGDG